MKSSGFTIIEIIISLFLLCIVSSSFLTITAFNMTAMLRASSSYEQVNHMEEVMDEVMSLLNEYDPSTMELENLEDHYSKEGIKVDIKPLESSKVLEVNVQDETTATLLQTFVLMP